MGAFFLYRQREADKIDYAAVQKTFEEKGFAVPSIFHLGENTLLLYKKQMVDVQNYYSESGYAIYAIGTFVYRALSYMDSLTCFLKDYIHDQVDRKEMLGSYCLILFDGKDTVIWNDALNVCELFTDSKDCFVTSSFLAAAQAQSTLTLNRPACIEKLVTGYIIGSDTLFKEIRRVIPAKENPAKAHWHFVSWMPIEVPSADRNRKKSIQQRADKVRDYLKRIAALAQDYHAELGLSGGYDSRLLYAASFSAWPFKLDIHTHSTNGVHIHDVERKIVTQMAETMKTRLRVVPTSSMDEYEEKDIERILKDGYYFFDGRCAYNMGAFSPVYTRAYKVSTMEDHRLTLNGLGGEMYRNYYMNMKPWVGTRAWMKANVYAEDIGSIVGRDEFNQLHRTVVQKMNELLPFRIGKWMSKFDICRYYSEMRMPDCDALNCNAHNQLEFYLTPFIEQEMIADAYHARKLIGLSGEYQAAMMKELEPTVASFPSHYGYPFDRNEPLKHKLYMTVRGLLPNGIWNLRVRHLYKKDKNNSNAAYFKRVRNKSHFLNEAAEYLERKFPEITFDALRKDYAMMPNSSYIAVTLYMLKEKINSEE